MRLPTERRRVLLAACACLLAAAAGARAQRVVAIGDIHGDLEAFTGILQAADLMDNENNWIGGSATLVQTGDFLDRGRPVDQVMDLLMDLQRQASKAGGEVVVLLGNHEALNLLGFRRDMNPETYELFVTPKSQARQDAAWQGYLRWRKRRAKAKREPAPGFDRAEEAEWRQRFPLGYFEFQDTLLPEGKYGRWLRTLPVAHQQGGSVFVHGGIPPSLSSWSIDRINQRAATEIERLDDCRARLLIDKVIHESSDPTEMVAEGTAELRSLGKRVKKVPPAVAEQLKTSIRVLNQCVDYQDWFLIKEDGPLWFRGYARWGDDEGSEQIAKLLAARRIRRFVVAHTVQKSGRIGVRWDGGVFLIDTGMLSSVYKGGQASALEIRGGTIRAIYPGDREVLWVSEPYQPPETAGGWLGPDGILLPFDDEDQVLEFLATAEIQAVQRLSQGINRPLRVSLEKDGVVAWAVFRRVDENKARYRLPDGRFFKKFKDSYRFEPAAYWISRTIGLDAVPPAVLRRHGGLDGSLQLWIHNVRDEKSRVEDGFQPPNSLEWLRQRYLRKLFDQLIANFDRNQGNILIDKDSWRVWLIDHTRAFLEEEELQEPDSIVQCDRRVFQGLRDVDREQLRKRLDPILSFYEIEALFERWQRVVDRLESLIGERGEEAVLFER